MLEKFVYVGPSWAYSGYPVEIERNNLALEWGIPHIDLSRPGTPILTCLERVKQMSPPTMPIVWVWGDPIANHREILDISLEDILVSDSWRLIKETLNQYCLARINELDRPVFLIGGHSDIENCNYPNITVAHHSWQKWLGQQAGVVPPDHCWAADIAHARMHQPPKFRPAKSVVDSMWDVYNYWEALEKHDLFFEVHPSKKGNIEFARFLKPQLDNFLSSL